MLADSSYNRRFKNRPNLCVEVGVRMGPTFGEDILVKRFAREPLEWWGGHRSYLGGAYPVCRYVKFVSWTLTSCDV